MFGYQAHRQRFHWSYKCDNANRRVPRVGTEDIEQFSVAGHFVVKIPSALYISHYRRVFRAEIFSPVLR